MRAERSVFRSLAFGPHPNKVYLASGPLASVHILVVKFSQRLKDMIDEGSDPVY